MYSWNCITIIFIPVAVEIILPLTMNKFEFHAMKFKVSGKLMVIYMQTSSIHFLAKVHYIFIFQTYISKKVIL